MLEEILYRKFLSWLEEDIPYADITAKLLRDECYEAVLLAKGDGIVAGLKIMAGVLERFGIRVKILVDEGEEFSRGTILARLRGSVKKILMLERTLLNVLSRLCGIAKLTRMAIKKARAINPNVRIAATRKTTPGLRFLEKYAVEVGGGDTHRFGLSDMILIKDNYLRVLGDVREALKLAQKAKSFAHKIEIEVTSIDDAIKAAELGADIIMLDNMPPGEIRKVVKKLEEMGLRSKVILEASGEINLDNIEDYASTGVDIISMGILTHSAPACNISLEVAKKCED